MEVEAGPVAGPSKEPISGPHIMRITDAGKIRVFVNFALNFLIDNADRPLVLHTLPFKHPPGHTVEDGPEKKKKQVAPCTDTVSKLISVVEIIKREFPKSFKAKQAAPAEGSAAPIESPQLHQYNQVGCLEDLDPTPPNPEAETEEARAARIRDLLQGKKHLKIKRTPYMKITLSRQPLDELTATGATYQPVVRYFNKAQKARAKRKAKKKAETTGGEASPSEEDDAMEDVPAEEFQGVTGSVVI